MTTCADFSGAETDAEVEPGARNSRSRPMVGSIALMTGLELLPLYKRMREEYQSSITSNPRRMVGPIPIASLNALQSKVRAGDGMRNKSQSIPFRAKLKVMA